MKATEATRHELTSWESILFEVLKERAEESETFEMVPEHILKAMDIQEKEKPGSKWVGNTLIRFSLFSEKLPRRYADGRKSKVQPYLFYSNHVLRMYEIYMRDTLQNEASQASQTEKKVILMTFIKRPTEPSEIVNDSDVGRMGRAKSGGIKEKISPIFMEGQEPLKEVEL